MKLVPYALLSGLLIFSVFAYFGTSSAQTVSVGCDSCYVNNCNCSVNCNYGTISVFTSAGCGGAERANAQISDGSAIFFPVQPGQYFVRAECNDNDQASGCMPVYVAAYSGQTVAAPIGTSGQETTTSTTTQQISTAGNTQTTSTLGIETTTATTGESVHASPQASGGLNSILTVAVGIAVGVVAGIFLIYFFSRRTGQDQYENLKQKWSG